MLARQKLLLGKVNFKLGRYHKSLNWLEAVILPEISEEEKAETYLYLGKSFNMLKLYELGITNFTLCLKFNPRHFEGAMALAHATDQRAKMLLDPVASRRAVRNFIEAAKINPDSVEALFGVIKTFREYEKNHGDAAIAMLEQTLDKFPRNYRVRTILAGFKLFKEDYFA